MTVLIRHIQTRVLAYQKDYTKNVIKKRISVVVLSVKNQVTY